MKPASELSSAGRDRPGPSTASRQTAVAAALTAAGRSMVVVSSANLPLCLSLSPTHTEQVANKLSSVFVDGKDKVARVANPLLLAFLTGSFFCPPDCLQPFLSCFNIAVLTVNLCCRHNRAYSLISFPLTTSPPLSVPPSLTLPLGLPPPHPSLLHSLWLHLKLP